MASKGKMPATERKIEESANKFLENLIDQALFVQDLLTITGTMLKEMQKNIHLLPEESRE